jgi:proteic killer suppression protein
LIQEGRFRQWRTWSSLLTVFEIGYTLAQASLSVGCKRASCPHPTLRHPCLSAVYLVLFLINMSIHEDRLFYDVIMLDISIGIRYYSCMILTWKNTETKKVWDGEYSKQLPVEIQRNARKKLVHIHGALDLNDLKIPPGNRLHSLKGNRKGQHLISINDQWRICFKWDNGNAFNVEITDYH